MSSDHIYDSKQDKELIYIERCSRLQGTILNQLFSLLAIKDEIACWIRCQNLLTVLTITLEFDPADSMESARSTSKMIVLPVRGLTKITMALPR